MNPSEAMRLLAEARSYLRDYGEVLRVADSAGSYRSRYLKLMGKINDGIKEAQNESGRTIDIEA